MRARVLLARLLFLVALVYAPAYALLPGCKPSPDPGATAQSKPRPAVIAEVESLKRSGTSWTNEEIRIYYNEIVGRIGPANEGWKREGISVEERARRAYGIRHDARLLTRAMMSIRDEVELLRKRDEAKYGNPDGPTFEYLVEGAKKKGVTGDAIFEGIIESAQRTDATTNEAFGIKK